MGRGTCCVRKKSSSWHRMGPLEGFVCIPPLSWPIMRIEVSPGSKDALERMTWPSHASAMSGMPDVVKSKVKSKWGSLWQSHSQFILKGHRLRTSGDTRTLAQLYKHFRGATKVEGNGFMRTPAWILGPTLHEDLHITHLGWSRENFWLLILAPCTIYYKQWLQ